MQNKLTGPLEKVTGPLQKLLVCLLNLLCVVNYELLAITISILITFTTKYQGIYLV